MDTQQNLQEFKFHHVHAFVDELKPIEVYKKMENSLNAFWKSKPDVKDHAKSREEFLKVKPDSWNADPKTFNHTGQDFIHQLIVARGFRITGEAFVNGTHTYLLNTQDPNGSKWIVSTKDKNENDKGKYAHFDGEQIDTFYKHQSGAQGFACMGFELPVGNLDVIKANFEKLHPKLIQGYYKHEGQNIFQTYAYYKGEVRESEVDYGTILRWIEVTNPDAQLVLPGFKKVDHQFADMENQVAYSDHWVSNVTSRVGFVQTLNETCGFTPKVDFNAGVVAAGEAQIESTVTGNTSKLSTHDYSKAFVDQSQVYLPTNNALSEVGHVYLYLKEIGQGIQHIADRVQNITSYIQRANDMREITGGGFTFLNIPRSYYGMLFAKDFENEISADQAKQALQDLQSAGLVDQTGIVNLDITKQQIESSVKNVPSDKLQKIVEIILLSRYVNMQKMLGDYFDEKTYMEIVNNKILVDIQGQDVLFQIFTTNVLQRKTGQESPFLEHIQRVCSTALDHEGNPKPLRAGCGGFGIRNFLTLFLSIEVSKAMTDYKVAVQEKDEVKKDKSTKMITAFTNQLNESNPILTGISDAMTAEADFMDELKRVKEEEKRKDLEQKIIEQRNLKEGGSETLKKLAAKYNKLMKEIREEKV